MILKMSNFYVQILLSLFKPLPPLSPFNKLQNYSQPLPKLINLHEQQQSHTSSNKMRSNGDRG